MTRINVGFKPFELTSKHLLAEHREIKRIGNAIKNKRFSLSNIPPEFTLGTGHVKFFYNKLKYVHERYLELYKECISRGFDVTNFEDAFSNMPPDLYQPYVEKPTDREITLGRLIERDNFYQKYNTQ